MTDFTVHLESAKEYIENGAPSALIERELGDAARDLQSSFSPDGIVLNIIGHFGTGTRHLV
jgi:hypothetical protein